MQRLFLFILTTVVVACFTACKPGVPSAYIQPGEMEDILYDYHVSQAVAMNDAEVDANKQLLYKEAVLKKYGVTSADFDSSMVYYMRHTERLHAIYENLAKRLSDEIVSLGADTNDMNRYSTLSNVGDTANIWEGDKAVVLSPSSAFNKLSFHIVADTTFHKGDSFMLNFNAVFMFQDGVKDGVAAICVKYDNDSIATQVMHISVSDHYQLNVSGDEHRGIKEVSGFLFLSKGGNSLTTMKMLFINNFQIIRFHQVKSDKKDGKKADSTQVNPDGVSSGEHTLQSTTPAGSASDTSHSRVIQDKVTVHGRDKIIHVR